MAVSIRPIRVNHINMVLEDFDRSVAHFRDVYGADFLLDLPQTEWNACLIEMGRVIFEIFVPPEFLLNSRHGPHYLGIEYQADMSMVRAAIADRDIRIVRDIGVALHTHAADTLGVSFEFYGGYFHDNEPIFGRPMHDAGYWRDVHPLGLTGLKAYRIAVHDIDSAADFLQSFLSAEPLYDNDLPVMAVRVRGFQVADCIVELLAATSDGPLRNHLIQCGQGIHSVVFGVRDMDQAREYLTARGLRLIAGVDPDGIAVAAADNQGVLFEFNLSDS